MQVDYICDYVAKCYNALKSGNEELSRSLMDFDLSLGNANDGSETIDGLYVGSGKGSNTCFVLLTIRSHIRIEILIRGRYMAQMMKSNGPCFRRSRMANQNLY